MLLVSLFVLLALFLHVVIVMLVVAMIVSIVISIGIAIMPVTVFIIILCKCVGVHPYLDVYTHVHVYSIYTAWDIHVNRQVTDTSSHWRFSFRCAVSALQPKSEQGTQLEEVSS